MGLLLAFVHAMLYAALPALFEPSRRSACLFAEDLSRRGFPPPRRGECARCPTADPILYLRRVRRNAADPRLRLEATIELARLGGRDVEAVWRQSRLFHAALALMPFAEIETAAPVALDKAA